MAESDNETNNQTTTTPAETGGNESTSTETPKLRPATEEEMSSMMRDFYNKNAPGTGGDDTGTWDWSPNKISTWDDDEMKAKLHAHIAANLPEGVNAQDALNRADAVAAQVKKNAIQYKSDKAKAVFEDRMTGEHTADDIVFNPEGGVNYRPSTTPDEPVEPEPEKDPDEEEEEIIPKASADEAKDATQKFLKHVGAIKEDGTVDPSVLANMDLTDLKNSLDEFLSANPDITEGIDPDEMRDRMSEIAQDVRDNAFMYVNDPNPEKGPFDPYKGVNFEPIEDDEEEPSDDDNTPEDSEKAAGTEPNKTPQSSPVSSGSDKPTGATKPVPGKNYEDMDNGKAFDGVHDSDWKWNRMAYGVLVAHNFHDYREALKRHLARLINDKDSDLSKQDDQSMQAAMNAAEQHLTDAEGYATLNNLTDTNGAKLNDKFMFKTPSVSDASVGGNDAINPYSAFNLDDDIVHDVAYVGGNEYGMGRCYSEMYESKQQILYLTMGIPKFRNLRTWLENAVDKELSELNDVGEPTGKLINSIGRLLSGTIKLAIQLPWLPFIWAANAISSIKDFKISEYFYFRDNMPLYYRYVNSILSEIAVGMGIYGNADMSADSNNAASDNEDKQNSKAPNGANMNTSDAAKYQQNLPAIMKEGPDIFKIMSRRALRMKGGVKRVETDDMLIGGETPVSRFRTMNNTHDKGETSWKNAIGQSLKNFWSGIQIGALEGMNFVGFRIEKNDQAQETFSNSTAESPLLQTLNQEVAKKREINLGAATSGEDLTSKMNRILKKAQSFTSNVTSIFSGKKGFEGTVAYMASGNGYFDLPKQWSGSAGMSRSLQFNMKLRARTGGDNVSIFQSIMIPLSMLMAAALPRAVGDTAFTSPFLVRAFCKGMFSVPAGIITSLAVSRGASEFGWSLSNLPTVVDVTFTIEDLSPMLFLSIAGGTDDAFGGALKAFTNNTKMHEYLNTLMGIGAKERYYRLGQLKRRLKTAILISKNTTFSATYRGYVMGDSSIIRSLMALTPYSWVKDN